MIRKNVRIDIDTAEDKGEQLFAMVTIISPDASALDDQPMVWFAWPGGGYNRHYFDLQLPGRNGSSEAEFHATKGSIFVACDHIGVGDSAIPAGAFNHSDIARTSAAVCSAASPMAGALLVTNLP